MAKLLLSSREVVPLAYKQGGRFTDLKVLFDAVRIAFAESVDFSTLYRPSRTGYNANPSSGFRSLVAALT